MSRYDLVVLGAGATGLGAARAARQGGHSVALVESDRPGGDCTHYGCVPSKALLECARRVAGARSGDDYGFHAEVEVDFSAVLKRVADVIAEVEQDESPALLARQGIELVTGRARFIRPDTVEVDGRRLSGRRFVVATGAHSALPPIEGLADVGYLDNTSVFALAELPDHLVVLGGGPIGCELAQAFRRLGSQVTIVEMAPRLVANDEPEAARVLRRVLEREGVRVLTGAAASKVEPGLTVYLADGQTVTGSHLLLALGRVPRTADLDLAVAGVQTDRRGRVVTDDELRTSAEHIYAAGDCTSSLQFTHVGDEQGRLAAANAFAPGWKPGPLGGRRSWDPAHVPWVTFTEPEIGRVGMSEAQAFAAYGAAARVAYLPLSSMDRARATGQTDGFVKLVAAPGRVLRGNIFLKLVGMTAVAPTGGELIAEGILALQAGTLVGRIAQAVHPYPTWSLATRYAAAQFFGSYGGRTARPAGPERS